MLSKFGLQHRRDEIFIVKNVKRWNQTPKGVTYNKI